MDPENNHVEVTTHEFAHVIAARADANRQDYPADKKEYWRKLDALRVEYIKQLLDYRKNGDNEGLHNYHLGQYASENINEFMAEGFTEYKLSSKPSPMAKKIGKLIDEYFKK